MAKAKKAQIEQDEKEVFDQPAAAVEAPESNASAAVSQDVAEFPETVSVKLSEWGVPMYQVVQVGAVARIYGKDGSPVSGVLPLIEASRQASRHNAMDPEQIDAKSRKKK